MTQHIIQQWAESVIKTPGEAAVIYCLSILEATRNKFDNYFVILQIHKHTKSVSGRLGDRFIEEIHSKIISFLRHELYYKRDLQYYTKDVFKAVNSSCNAFHVCKPPAELQQMGWNHHTGKLSDTLSRQAHHLRVGFQFEISGQPSRWACTLG